MASLDLDPVIQMEDLYVKTINAIEDQIKAFNYFRGEHSKLDLLLCNMETIMSKYRQDLVTVDAFHKNNLFDNSDCNQSKKRKLNVSIIHPIETGLAQTLYQQDKDGNISENENEAEVQVPIDHKMFTVELVMLKILNFLPLSDLKRCRQVNSYFKLFADQVIFNRKLTVVTFEYKRSCKKYVGKTYGANTEDKDMKDFTLSTFTQFYANRPGFPCEIFHFVNGTLRSPDLQEFLTICGKRIGELFLEVFFSLLNQMDDYPETIVSLYPTVNLLKKLLFHQVPNLQSLSLRDCPTQWNLDEYFNHLFPEPQRRKLTLPVLQTLSLDNTVPDSLVDSILDVCTNLQFCHGKHNLLLKRSQLYFFKDWTFDPDPSDLQLYENVNFSLMSRLTFLNWSPRRSFGIPAWLPKQSQILFQILEASSATLEHINWFTPVGFLPDLQIPVLSKLKEILISTANLDWPIFRQLTKKQFPSGFNLSFSFPNLQNVEIKANVSTGDEKWEDYFDNYTPVLTVKTLILKNGRIPNSWFQNFAHLFPNILTLKIRTDYFHPSSAAQCGLWSFTQLEHLTMQIDLEEDLNYFPYLDSAFTGFSLETCSELQKSSNNFDLTDINALREFPSIVNLKNLKKLKLRIIDYEEESRLRYPPILTNLTCLFAFEMCPQLKVIATGNLSNSDNSQSLMNSLSVLEEFVDIKFPF